MTNGPLVHLLRNRMYRGELNHRDKSYPGEHQPIIDQTLFDEVQAKLSGNRRGNRLRSQRSEALLLGRLFDDRGNKMTPSYAIKKGVRYPYYVSCVLAQGRKEEAGSVSRVGANAIETIVLDALAALSPSTEAHHRLSQPSSTTIADPEQSASFSAKERIERLANRIVIGAQSVEIRLADDPGLVGRPKSITIPWSPQTFRRKREVIQPTDASGSARPIRAEARATQVGIEPVSRHNCRGKGMESPGDPRPKSPLETKTHGLRRTFHKALIPSPGGRDSRLSKSSAN
jgi:site-specific DNA recombinase